MPKCRNQPYREARMFPCRNREKYWVCGQRHRPASGWGAGRQFHPWSLQFLREMRSSAGYEDEGVWTEKGMHETWGRADWKHQIERAHKLFCREWVWLCQKHAQRIRSLSPSLSEDWNFMLLEWCCVCEWFYIYWNTMSCYKLHFLLHMPGDHLSSQRNLPHNFKKLASL